MAIVDPVLADSPQARPHRQNGRSAQIVAAAARLFGQQGYHSVSLQDIGSEVGLDASSLYFHFPNKEAIFVAVVNWLIDSSEELYEGILSVPGSPVEHLAAVTEQTLRSQVLQRRYFLATPGDLQLVPRELRRELISKRRSSSQRRVDCVMQVHPQLTTSEAELVVEASACISIGLTHHRSELPKSQLVDLLASIGLAAVLLPPITGKTRSTGISFERGPSDESQGGPRSRRYERNLASARERILTDATSLFRRRGFDGVGVEAIAGASGITGPGVYRHFESKQEILNTIFHRAIGELAAITRRSFDAAANARDALDRLVAAYVDLALHDSEVIAVFWTQRQSLDRETRLLVSRELRAFAKDWAGVLCEVRPELNDAAARTMVYEALWVMNGYWWYNSELPVVQADPLLRSMALNALLAPELP